METKLNSLRDLIEKLLVRIDIASKSSNVSSIETDIMLDLLRQAYIATEELRFKESVAESHKAPVVQVVQPPQPIEEEMKPYKNPIEEKNPVLQPEMPIVQEKEQEVKNPLPQPEMPKVQEKEQEVILPVESKPEHEEIPVEKNSAVYVAPSVLHTSEPEMIIPTPVSIDEVPKMSFPKVEVSLDPPATQPISVPTAQHTSFDHNSSQQYSQPQPSAQQYSAPQPVSQQYSAPQPSAQDAPLVAKPAKIETPAPSRPTRHESDLFGGPTIADKLKSETPSLNERITQGRTDQSLAHKMQLKPISDLRTAIGINEKFQFVNDLFEGKIEWYNDAIANLNNCNSGIVADNILYDLKLKHNWTEDTEAYNKLKNFIVRRYM